MWTPLSSATPFVLDTPPLRADPVHIITVPPGRQAAYPVAGNGPAVCPVGLSEPGLVLSIADRRGRRRNESSECLRGRARERWWLRQRHGRADSWRSCGAEREA